MSLIPRVIVSFVAALLGLIGLIKYEKWPPEVYTPPPLLYQNATSKAYGTITGTAAKGLGDHIFEGSNTFYYVDYTFHPYIYTIDAHGRKHIGVSPIQYSGAVRIDFEAYSSITKGSPIIVKYDPVDPGINGVPNTKGLWSTTTGYMNPYLWYYVGVLVAGLALQEIIRMATRTNDFR